MTFRGALIGAAAGAVFFYVTDPNKGSSVDFLGYVVLATQFMAAGALVRSRVFGHVRSVSQCL